MRPLNLLKQFGIILGVTLVGEVLHALIPIAIPAGIYGIVIMLILLCLKVIKPEMVRDASSILLGWMPMMFVPPLVGMMNDYTNLSGNVLNYLLVLVVTTFLVMVASGAVTQFIIRRKEKRNHE